MKRAFLIMIMISTWITSASPQEATRWRGPSADGSYPDKGLLKNWPENGPEILWSFEQLGVGFASPTFYGGYIYIPTMLGDQGYIFKLDMSGKLVWKAKYGTEYTDRYPGTRSSVTVAGDLLYMLSGIGKLVCMNTKDGSVRWSKELTRDFDGVINRYGYNETIVVDGDRLYATPGGKKNNVVALNRFTGSLIWTCPGKGEKAAYCTPQLIKLPARHIRYTHRIIYTGY